MLTTRPRGTNDILPADIDKWHQLEKIIHSVSKLYGYQEIRTPIFEHTELFLRGVGETTDIVEKEMYTFQDRGERSLTLRPEGTAPVVRAFVENKLYANPQPTKLYYFGPMFRYDRPQAGRYRQFHQFGVEVFGAEDPVIDAEVIAMAMDIYERLGLNDLTVLLNSVGCAHCRPIYQEELKKYLGREKSRLCPTCQNRFEKNPLRVFDCKSETCQEILTEAPTLRQLLCTECEEHFNKVQDYLQAFEVSYQVEPRLVRGLDYYTRTAFEITVSGIGAQSSIGGGGRYDGLVEQCGGPAMSGVGFALGLERILLALKEQGIEREEKEEIPLFVAALGEKAQLYGAIVAQKLRKNGLAVEMDYLQRSLKAQLKAANRLGARYTVILGEEELANQEVVIRKMTDSTQRTIKLGELEEFLLEELRKGTNHE